MLKNEGLTLAKSPESIKLKAAIEFLEISNTTAQQEKRLKVVIETLTGCFESIGKMRRRTQTIDAVNIMGLARAHAAMKNYDKSLKFYGDLVKGIDRGEYPEFYWSAQLERSRCLLEAFRTDTDQMRRLGVLIRQLRLEDKSMGGLSEEFAAIDAQVVRAATPPK